MRRTLGALAIAGLMLLGCRTPEPVIRAHELEREIFVEVTETLRMTVEAIPAGSPGHEEARAELLKRLEQRREEFLALSTYLGKWLRIRGYDEEFEKVKALVARLTNVE